MISAVHSLLDGKLHVVAPSVGLELEIIVGRRSGDCKSVQVTQGHARAYDWLTEQLSECAGRGE